MKAVLKIFVLFAALFLCAGTQAQELSDREYRRWIYNEPRITEITINGNDYTVEGDTLYTDSEIRKLLFSREVNKGFFSNFVNIITFRFIKGDRRKRIQRETMAKDTTSVIQHYLTNGFLGVKVNEEFEPVFPENGNGDTSAHIIVNIDEGRRFYYDSINVTGNFEDKFHKDINSHIREIESGEPVNPLDLRRTSFELKTLFANNGYPYASAKYRIDTTTDTNLADITFKIESDSLVHFGKLKIYGSNYWPERSARREVTFKDGDIYEREEIIESQQNLLETGYYETLRLDSKDPDTAEIYNRLNPNFILHLKEKKPHFVSLKTGAAQDSIKDLIWSFNGSWGKRNFLKNFGGPYYLELSAAVSYVIFTEWRLRDHHYRARITDPWFLGIKLPVTLTGQWEPGVRSLVQPYRKETWLASVATTFRVTRDLTFSGGFQYENITIYGVGEEAEEQIKIEQGISARRRIYAHVERDTRNNIFNPSLGSHTTFRAEYTGGFLGGGESYYLLESGWSKYQKTWPGWTMAFRIKSGYVKEFDFGEDVPADERFYIGGANTVRGFSERDLGPKSEQGNPIGANFYILSNLEFRYQLVGNFWSSLFIDVGNGFRRFEDVRADAMAVSYGIGIQYMSPAGPIRLDYARHFPTKEFGKGDKFHFTILYAF